MKIAIIGKGNVGGNLGARLEKSGFDVTYGLKDNAAEAAKKGDVVFLAVPGSVALDVARSLAKELEGKIVVDCNNALKWDQGPVWTPPAEGSLTAAIAKAVPGARVLKAFNGFGAEHHADPNLTGAPANVFLAGDDADAKKTLSEIARKAGFAPVDAGPLRNAAVLENVAILWIHLGTVGGHGRNFVFEMRGAK